jgi:hypothetical protein
MSEHLLRMLEMRVDLRGFLRGSSLAAAALLGLAATPAFGQDPARPSEPAERPEQPQQPEQAEAETTDNDDDRAPAEEPEEGAPSEETRVDAEGRPYRICPQCGFNMYKQERTWTCENCGYSYVE